MHAMRAILQRVSQAKVTVNGAVTGQIAQGYVIFLGVGQTDTKENAEKLADKIQKLRLFADDEGKTNRSIADIQGGVLVISQFTLYADCKKGTRPSFVDAAPPEMANELYEYFLYLCKARFSRTEHGVFGAHMQVALENDGPFTIYLES